MRKKRINNIVPVLITCDIDPAPEVNSKDKKSALELTSILFDKYGIKGTFLFVADTANLYASQIRQLQERGHEIGCHGLRHDETEEYDKLPEDVQRGYLIRATKTLEDLTGNSIVSFRGPRAKTSHITQRILEQLHYLADSSVCSQRIDLISSNLINPGWIFAPRLPYHPNESSAFRKGNRNLRVIPVSAIILPFVSGVLYLFGEKFFKIFFDILYFESQKTGKPIVYLMHPMEFAKQTKDFNYKSSLRSIRTRGFYFRRRLKLRIDENARLRYTIHLFEHIKKHINIEFMTINQYVDVIS
ncbi:MAG: polysaccharide deacetylase family protein [Candidatus Hodarchaeota archaeon]